MKQIGYHRARSPSHAVDLASDHGGEALFLAGGQSLTNVMKARLIGDDNQVIDLGDLDELSYIEADHDVVRIGALTTHSDLAESDRLTELIPAFPEMVAQVGDVQIRNMGTIGGDMAQADPQADYPVLLTALGGDVTILTPDSERTESLSDFFISYYQTALEPAELLVEVEVHRPDEDHVVGFQKFSERRGDFPLVNAAAVLETDGDTCTGARIRVGCVSGAPVAATDAEDSIEGTPVAEIDPSETGRHAREEITPDPDEEVDVAYKNELVEAMVSRAIEDAIDRLQE